MVDGDKKFGVVLYVEVGGMGEFSHRECLYFSPLYRTAFRAFSETNAWLNSVRLCLIFS
jgi:hypothetical protein